MGSSGSDFKTADECISAGMYWFGQSDLGAAEAWWKRALELEPEHPRALECLALLEKTSSTGYKRDSWARLPVVTPEGPTATVEALAAAPTPDLEVTEDVGFEFTDEEDDFSLKETSVSGSTDLRLFVDGAEEETSSERALPVESMPGMDLEMLESPWDEGPSKTSVITLQSSGPFDAVADPTPIPDMDRGRFFNRAESSSKDEIVDFLRSTGDVTAAPSSDLGLFAAEEDRTESKTGRVRLNPGDFDPQSPLSDDLGPLSTYADGISTEPITAEALASDNALDLARSRYQLHDFQGVLDALGDFSVDDDGPVPTEVRNMLAESKAHLIRMYEAKIGHLDRIPVVKVSSEEVIWLNLNHRAGFILSQVDGLVSYEDLISLSGMPRLDTVKILTELLDQNVITPSE